jgi:tetratricopeptide (TPR) repeat protein
MRLLRLAAAFAAAILCSAAIAQDLVKQEAARGEIERLRQEADCGDLQYNMELGVHDYRRPPKALLDNVERHHFMAEVEQLGHAPNALEAEIGYVLNYFPNHHRALFALARLTQKRKSENFKAMRLTVKCHFVRALSYAPDDARVRMIYGFYLAYFNHNVEALRQLRTAEALGATDANTLYNIGLVYFDLRDYERSLEYAKRAYAAGFQLPGLRTKLQSAGKWRD